MHLAGRLGQQGVHAGAGLFLGITTENLLGDTLSCGNIFQRGDLQVGFRTGDNGDGFIRQIIDLIRCVFVGGMEVRVGGSKS